MKRRKHKKVQRGKNVAKVNRATAYPMIAQLKGLRGKGFIPLLSLFVSSVGVLLILLTFYSPYSEPDIRPVSPCSYDVKFLGGEYDYADGSDVLSFSIRQKLKNHSAKSGHLERIEFVPTSLAIIPKFEMAHVDRGPIGWGEEKEVEARAIIRVNPAMRARLFSQGNKLSARFLSYDNTGKVIQNDDGQPFYLDLDLGASPSPASQIIPASMSGEAPENSSAVRRCSESNL